MKVSGFSFIRNAIKYDYPIVEAIESVLPLCDEFVLAVGNSDDDTLKLVSGINPAKIKIIETIWDDSKREGGKVLAEETNKAFQAVSRDSDWAFYIQGDEVMHEKYIENVYNAMKLNKDNQQVEGLLFKYVHFYGSYDYIGDSRRWYRNEVRVVRPRKEIQSYRDAQGFRINGQKLKVMPANAEIYHYGWVKNPYDMQKKHQSFHKYWHDDQWVKENVGDSDLFDYSKIDSLNWFKGDHPKCMQNRINNINWKFSFDPTVKKMSLKNKILYKLEKLTGYRVGEYKNYKLL